MKRIIAVLLSVSLLLAFPFITTAATPSTVTDETPLVTVEELLTRNNITLDEDATLSIQPLSEQTQIRSFMARNTAPTSEQGDSLQITTVTGNHTFDTLTIIPYVEDENGALVAASLTFSDVSSMPNIVTPSYVDVFIRVEYYRVSSSSAVYVNPQMLETWFYTSPGYTMLEMDVLYQANGGLYGFDFDTGEETYLNQSKTSSLAISESYPTYGRTYRDFEHLNMSPNIGIKRGTHIIRYRFSIYPALPVEGTINVLP